MQKLTIEALQTNVNLLFLQCVSSVSENHFSSKPLLDTETVLILY